MFGIIDCIKNLGFFNGLRYFCLNVKAARDPDLISRWRNNCENEAVRLRLTGNIKEAEMFEDWSLQLAESQSKNSKSHA